ncbi:MAG: hypothetical protein E7400_00880 [Ruminococcaceae bacterium]|nr:hypothetical protein [Oscillospiraceae bacterium]
MMIETVLGPIESDKLGVIAPHEHFFIDTTFEAQTPDTEEELELFNSPVNIHNIDVLRRNPFLVRDNMVLEDLDTIVYEVNRFKKAGGNTIVDLTNIGIKRDLAKIREVSRRTGVNVIAGCGLYTGLTIPEPYSKMNEDELACWMIDEIKNGDPETGIKPGVIGEIGTSETVEPLEATSLRAAAYANLETGLPIYIHTYPWSRASLDAIDILVREGVKPEQICICHLDVAFDHEYLSLVFDTGAYAMFDNFGKEYYFPKTEAVFSGGPFETDLDRVRMIIRIVKEGHADRLMLATDVCLKSLLHSFGGWSYDHIFTNIAMMMENEGIAKEDIDTILMKNPLEFICSRR